MLQIPDDPVIRSMERTGYPPENRYRWWAFSLDDDDDEWEEDEDVYFGSETEDF